MWAWSLPFVGQSTGVNGSVLDLVFFPVLALLHLSFAQSIDVNSITAILRAISSAKKNWALFNFILCQFYLALFSLSLLI